MTRLAAAALVAFALHGFAAAPAGQEAVPVETLVSRAEAGDLAATRALAQAYYLGRGGVAQDFGQAARWYRVLAARGEASAQTTLGLMYARGWGVEQDLAAARRWWSLAAAQNDPGAQHNLGMVYLQGQGVAQDLPQALHWFRHAAERGHVASQRLVGLMYFEGKGTAADAQLGLKWLTIAAESGEEGAQQALAALGERITAEERRAARAQALEWLARHRPR